MNESRRRRRRERSAAKRQDSFPREIEREASSGRVAWMAAVALVAATVWVYLPVRGYPFIGFDDPGYVTENPNVKGGLSTAAVWWALTTGHMANWHPLTWISHEIDVQLFGLNAGAHHLVNLGLHVANTLLLFVLLTRTTRAIGRSALVAALFALHPMHVESVAWVAERKDVLSTFFWLLTMWAYVSWVREPRAWRYGLLLLWFALGLASKPMRVTLPCALLLVDVWPLRRVVVGETPRRAWLGLVTEKLPLFGLAAASSVVTYVAQRRAGAMQSFEALSLPIRIVNAILAYGTYLKKLAVPSELGLLYPYQRYLPVLTALAVLVVLAVASVVSVRSMRTRPYLATGWFWFLGTLVPVIGIVQVGKQPMADRYTYVPSIGLFIAVVWGVSELQRLNVPRQALVAASVLAVALYTWAARRQVEYWHSGVELWEHTIAVTEDNYLAHNNLGFDLARSGRPLEAIPHYDEAIRLSPRLAGVRSNAALALLALGRTDEAITRFEDELRLTPENYLVRANLGFALSRQGRLEEAIKQLTEAIRLKSDYTEAHNALGLALARTNDLEGAKVHYRESLRLKPDFAEAHNNLGAALASEGNLDDAVVQFTEAIRLKPDYVDAHNNLGVALSTQGKYDAAVMQFRDALRIDANYAKARYGLGLALQRQGRIADAAAEFATVLRIHPADDDARRALEQLRQ
jgi:tetratricopeptide (TPR) repeat protein